MRNIVDENKASFVSRCDLVVQLAFSLVLVLVVLLLNGCNGGNDSNGGNGGNGGNNVKVQPKEPSKYKTIAVIDGPISQVEVYVDYNWNGTVDKTQSTSFNGTLVNEYQGTTDTSGKIRIYKGDRDFKVYAIVKAGVSSDRDSGVIARDHVLVGNMRDDVVSPISTIADLKGLSLEAYASELELSYKVINSDFTDYQQSASKNRQVDNEFVKEHVDIDSFSQANTESTSRLDMLKAHFIARSLMDITPESVSELKSGKQRIIDNGENIRKEYRKLIRERKLNEHSLGTKKLRLRGGKPSLGNNSYSLDNPQSFIRYVKSFNDKEERKKATLDLQRIVPKIGIRGEKLVGKNYLTKFTDFNFTNKNNSQRNGSVNIKYYDPNKGNFLDYNDPDRDDTLSQKIFDFTANGYLRTYNRTNDQEQTNLAFKFELIKNDIILGTSYLNNERSPYIGHFSAGDFKSSTFNDDIKEVMDVTSYMTSSAKRIDDQKWYPVLLKIKIQLAAKGITDKFVYLYDIIDENGESSGASYDTILFHDTPLSFKFREGKVAIVGGLKTGVLATLQKENAGNDVLVQFEKPSSNELDTKEFYSKLFWIKNSDSDKNILYLNLAPVVGDAKGEKLSSTIIGTEDIKSSLVKWMFSGKNKDNDGNKKDENLSLTYYTVGEYFDELNRPKDCIKYPTGELIFENQTPKKNKSTSNFEAIANYREHCTDYYHNDFGIEVPSEKSMNTFFGVLSDSKKLINNESWKIPVGPLLLHHEFIYADAKNKILISRDNVYYYEGARGRDTDLSRVRVWIGSDKSLEDITNELSVDKVNEYKFYDDKSHILIGSYDSKNFAYQVNLTTAKIPHGKPEETYELEQVEKYVLEYKEYDYTTKTAKGDVFKKGHWYLKFDPQSSRGNIIAMRIGDVLYEYSIVTYNNDLILLEGNSNKKLLNAIFTKNKIARDGDKREPISILNAIDDNVAIKWFNHK